MPNFLGYAALPLWFLVTIALFLLLRPTLAGVLTLLLGWMFLPETVTLDLPSAPPLDKHSVTALYTLAACLVTCPRRLLEARRWDRLDWFIVLRFVGIIGTVVTNHDLIVHASTVLPALKPYDALSIAVRDVINLLVSYYLGRALIRDSTDLRDLLTMLAAGGLLYSLFIFIEIRFSPQMNVWFYGFHQHSFGQTLRGGGYRPMVFMSHGLTVAAFMLFSTMAALALSKLKAKIVSFRASYSSVYLSITLILCKSAGAIIYFLFTFPIILWTKPRTQMRIAAILAGLVLVYPTLKSTDLFPSKTLVSLAESISAERAQSLGYRFDNDIALASKIRERPLFGWGGYQRGNAFNEDGVNLSILDGQWLIELSTRGIAGFLGLFMMMLGPVFLANARFWKLKERRDQVMVAALALIITVAVVDLLPNAIKSDFELFLPGALLGFLRGHANAPGKSNPRPASPAEAIQS